MNGDTIICQHGIVKQHCYECPRAAASPVPPSAPPKCPDCGSPCYSDNYLLDVNRETARCMDCGETWIQPVVHLPAPSAVQEEAPRREPEYWEEGAAPNAQFAADPQTTKAFKRIFDLTVQLHKRLGTQDLMAIPLIAEIQSIARTGRAINGDRAAAPSAVQEEAPSECGRQPRLAGYLPCDLPRGHEGGHVHPATAPVEGAIPTEPWCFWCGESVEDGHSCSVVPADLRDRIRVLESEIARLTRELKQVTEDWLSGNARTLAAEADVARLTRERDKSRELFAKARRHGAEQFDAIGILTRELAGYREALDAASAGHTREGKPVHHGLACERCREIAAALASLSPTPGDTNAS
jgi:hypothetical protein